MNQTIRKLECDALLFDLDGVLIDSSVCILRHWKKWAHQHNLDLGEIMQVAHGTRTIDTMQMVAPHLDAAAEAERFTSDEVQDTDGVVPIAGALQILYTLPKQLWAIVTSGNLALANARLTHAKLPLSEVLITADDVANGKPFPEPYLLGAQHLSVSPERCIVVEDAPAGVEAGKRAGMRVIGIEGTHQREELFNARADYVIEKLSDLRISENSEQYRLVIHI